MPSNGHVENTVSSIVASVSVVAEMCLLCHSLAMATSTRSTILALSCHVMSPPLGIIIDHHLGMSYVGHSQQVVCPLLFISLDISHNAVAPKLTHIIHNMVTFEKAANGVKHFICSTLSPSLPLFL
jgi:hypothetical protein